MNDQQFDVIIIGGSYSGLAAAMALGRAMRTALVIDSGTPCNIQTPYSHNFLTQDGSTPGEIAAQARRQVSQYPTVRFVSGTAAAGRRTDHGFEIANVDGATFSSRRLIFATGIKDEMPDIPGFADCWGITALHCPYCHGYEVRNTITGILGDGDAGFELAGLVSNWTPTLTLFTNGPAALSGQQAGVLVKNSVRVIETGISAAEHRAGRLHALRLDNGQQVSIDALYSVRPFRQQCPIPTSLGCELTAEGYIKVDALQRTTIPGVYASGDNSTRIRTVANAVAAGTTAGMMLNKELVLGDFVNRAAAAT